jgi:nitroimidazol reductase NimA-like FMN-containing flavoprotein (pyridoxamine 5'-phosphate oxidase superfamily)
MVHTELGAPFSAPDAKPTDWSDASATLEKAELYWLTTVRPSGQPHVTPLIGLFHEGTFYFCTGDTERKYRNLELNPQVAVTTGDNALRDGLDLVVEGSAVKVVDEDKLRRLAGLWEQKYTSEWHFEVEDGAFKGDNSRATVFQVVPTTAFAFAKGEYAQTKYTF